MLVKDIHIYKTKAKTQYPKLQKNIDFTLHKTRLEQSPFLIKNLEDFQAIPEIFKNEVVFLEAMDKAELPKMSEADLAAYYAGLKSYRDNISKIKTAKKEGLKKRKKKELKWRKRTSNWKRQKLPKKRFGHRNDRKVNRAYRR